VCVLTPPPAPVEMTVVTLTLNTFPKSTGWVRRAEQEGDPCCLPAKGQCLGLGEERAGRFTGTQGGPAQPSPAAFAGGSDSRL
jgi:hypothetical protein